MAKIFITLSMLAMMSPLMAAPARFPVPVRLSYGPTEPIAKVAAASALGYAESAPIVAKLQAPEENSLRQFGLRRTKVKSLPLTLSESVPVITSSRVKGPRIVSPHGIYRTPKIATLRLAGPAVYSPVAPVNTLANVHAPLYGSIVKNTHIPVAAPVYTPAIKSVPVPVASPTYSPVYKSAPVYRPVIKSAPVYQAAPIVKAAPIAAPIYAPVRSAPLITAPASPIYSHAAPIVTKSAPLLAAPAIAVKSHAVPVVKAIKEQHIAYPPQPYSFGYKSVDEYGNQQSREEVSDANNHKKGSYSYTDAKGISRRVEYVADSHGFRATIKTNEPGTAPSNPAAALYTPH